MPLTFIATQFGTDEGMSGVSSTSDVDPVHYVLYGKDADGVYFEFDDQRRGGYDRVKQVLLAEDAVRFVLETGESIIVVRQMAERDWSAFEASLYVTFGEAVLAGA